MDISNILDTLFINVGEKNKHQGWRELTTTKLNTCACLGRTSFILLTMDMHKTNEIKLMKQEAHRP